MLLDEDCNVKIADFGTAKIIAGKNAERPTSTQIGTKAYVPPEIYHLEEGEVYNGKLFDIYSCGIILFQLLTGKVPFSDSDTTDKNNFYKKAFGFQKDFIKAFGLSRTVGNLFFEMVAREPTERPQIAEI